MDLRKRIEREFFRGATVRLNWDANQNVNNGVLTIGGNVGVRGIEELVLFHEMSHFVEIDEARMFRRGWGLVAGTPKLGRGKIKYIPKTTQSIERECRVVAYQVNLAKHFGVKQRITDFVATFVFMPDFSLIPVRGPDSTRERLQWCVRRIYRLRRKPEYQVKAFRSEWWRRNAILADQA